jgi:acetyl-CoA decarbonylase/synthase complex subunit epsilon
MMRAEPWQTGETAGPEKAQELKKIEVIKALLKKADSPLLVVGAQSITTKYKSGDMVDYFIKLAKKAKIPIVATAQTIKAFREKGFTEAVSLGAMEVINLLTDPEWKGAHNKGPHDLVLTFGYPYYYEWLMLAGLINFARQIKTVTLGRYFQPHASWSFPNLKEKNWYEALDKLLTIVGGSKTQ